MFLIDPYRFSKDDAANYISRVEAADGQPLEDGVRDAINAFVVGCKADSIWNAIKASCILSGAHTLAGALEPLVGTAPTNFNFVSGDYSRKTGLAGDGVTKYLNSNRNNNADPQDSKHLAVWQSTVSTVNGTLLGSGVSSGDSILYVGYGSFITRNNSSQEAIQPLTASPSQTFYGTSRLSGPIFTVRHGGVNYECSSASQVPANASILVFNAIINSFANITNARLAFYSIGESIDLAKLDARLTALFAAFAAAIP